MSRCKLRSAAAGLMVITVAASLCVAARRPTPLQDKKLGKGVTYGRHPSIFFTADELPALRERVKRKPLSGWYAEVKARADKLLAKPTAQIKGYNSRWGSVDLALVYSITNDKRYADKARDILLDIDYKHLKLRINKIYQGYSGSAYALAYDMIHPALTPAERKKIRDALVDSLQSLHGGYPYANIWLVRAEGAGLGGLAFDMPKWVEGAKHAFKTVFSAAESGKPRKGKSSSYRGSIKEGGAFIEGQGYAVMGAIQITPFLVALKRNGGENLFRFPKYRELLNQSVLSLSPTGTIHRFEDSDIRPSRNNAVILHTAAANAPSPEEAGLWLWGYNKYVENHGEPHRSEATTILTWREVKAKPLAPKVVSWIIPKSGLAFLRSGWGKDDLYLAMTCKPYYHMHSHRDENSIEIWAHGALLLALPGYPGWARPYHKDWAVTTEASNTIKINGREQQGPEEKRLMTHEGNRADGYRGYLLDGPVEYVSGDASRLYAGAKFVRNVVFVKPTPTVPGYYLLLDNIKTAKPTDKIDWLLHGRGKMTVKGRRTVWTVNSFTDKKPVSLHVEILTPKVAITQKEGWLAFEGKNIPYISARHEGPADYLSVLYPAKQGQAAPSITKGATTVSAVVGSKDLFFARAGGGNIKAGGLSTDAEFCFLRKGATGLRLFLARKATSLDYRGDTFLKASAPVDVSIAVEPTRTWGVISTAAATTVTLRCTRRPDSITVSGKALPFTWSNGKASFSVKGPCRIVVGDQP